MRKVCLFIAVLSVLACGIAQGGIVTYTNEAAWLAALAGAGQSVLNTETFDAGGLQSFTSVTVNVGTSAIGPARGLLTGSVWQAKPSANTNTYNYIGVGTLYGIGAIWDTTPGGEGSGLDLTALLAGGGTASIGHLGATDNAFFGFISTVPITGFTAAGVSENYDLDNMQFGGGAVPEPGTWILISCGLGAIAVRRLKSK